MTFDIPQDVEQKCLECEEYIQGKCKGQLMDKLAPENCKYKK